MYRATISAPFFLADYRVPEGRVLVENVTASSVLLLRSGSLEPYTPRVNPPFVSGMTALLIRPGGYGDLLFLTPIIAKLFDIGVKVTVSTHTHFQDILIGQPCELAPYPMLESDIDKFDAVCWLEDAVENSLDSTNIVDLFAARVGVDLTDKACRYFVSMEERQWAVERFPRNGKPRIGVQARASAESRSYPEKLLQITCSMMIEKGYEVVLFGAPGSMKAHPSYVCLPAHGLSMRQSLAVLESCDACIAPDSAITHAAGAMGINCVSLYSSFPWQSRTKYHPSVHAITGHAPCAPCFHHARTEPFPTGKPCATAKMCVALAEIKPERIVAKIDQLILR